VVKISGGTGGFKNPMGGYKRELLGLARKLYKKGFKVVPVGGDMKPLGGWSPEQRLKWEEIEEAIKSGKAMGIALVAGSENPFKDVNTVLVILSIDDPAVLEKLPSWLRYVLENETVVWKTEPRCPECWSKHDVQCVEGICMCSECGAEFKLKDAPRGLAALFYADKDTIMKTGEAVKGGPVELAVNDYQPLPPSLHPSGARYEWIRPFDFEKPNFGIYSLTPEEYGGLYETLRELKEETTRARSTAKTKAKTETRAEVKPQTKPEVKVKARAKERKEATERAGIAEKRLTKEEYNRIAEKFLLLCVKEDRNHIVLSFVELMFRSNMSYESD